ncbi:MAG: hypothetical protein WKF43_01610 [Acidimicrobiales bacterium]
MTTSTESEEERVGLDVWADVVGQPVAVRALQAAVDRPAHAWMFVGPPGSGTRAAACAFAAELVSAGTRGTERERHRRLARAEQHPDVTVIERTGAQISVGQADEIVLRASRTATEGTRKVIILDEFHFVIGPAAGKLLKSIEEPPAGTFFIVLAEEVPPELVTIASRCNRVDFPALDDEAVTAALEAEGVDARRAAEAAGVASGDLDRARLLATDDRLVLRLRQWHELPDRLDGTGQAVTTLVDDIRAGIDDAAGPLQTRQAGEVVELTERIERYGLRGSGSGELEKRHRREQRRLRTDELRMGFVELARRYRDDLSSAEDVTELLAALDAIQAAIEALIRNPSEELLLQALLLRLPPFASRQRAGR